MKIMSKIILTALVFVGTVIPQSIEANYQLDYVTVHYTWVARAMESSLDFTGGYDLMGSWPSSATPAFQWTLSSFAIGDTITEVLVPLTFQGALDFFPFGPVALNCTFNDDGTFTINEGSTYPTTQLIDCETSSTVPPVSESGTWTDGGHSPYTDGFLNTSVRGWGITQSGTFAWFTAPDLGDGTDGGGMYNTNMQYDGINWGRFDATYNNDYSQIQDAWVRWTANDGIESNLGIVDPTDDDYLEEEAGMLNGIMGIATAPSDISTIPTVAAWAAQYGIVIHVPEGDAVALGGTGDADMDGVPTGLVSANYGYLFDPIGADGWPFGFGPDMTPGTEDDNPDEFLQFTGYYFTGNLMNAAGIGQGTMTACGTAYVSGDDPAANGGLGNGCLFDCFLEGGGDPANVPGCIASCSFLSVEECIDDATVAVLTTFGLEGVAPGLAGVLGGMAYAEGNVGPCLLGGGDQLTCVLGGVLWAVGAAQVQTGGAWMFPNDSDHDVDLACLADGDPSDCTGRLIMEVDNLCLPRMSTQRINARFQNTANAHGAANPVFMSTAAGWNMVGLPIVAGGYEYGDMFGIDLTGDGIPDTPGATDGTLYSFDGSYNEEAAMAPGQGYWLRFDTPCCDPAIYGVPGHPMGGYDLLTQTISLSEGWNMISGISVAAEGDDIDDPGDILVEGSEYGFSGTYYPAEFIEPGQGYWVRANADGAITIAIGAGGAGKITEPVNYLKNANYLTITNGDGLTGMPLHFGATVPENEQIRYGLPPLPPAGAFDTRFSDDMRYTEDMGTIEIMNNTKSLSIDYYVVNQEKWILTFNDEEHLLERSGVIELDGTVNSVTLRKEGTVPGSFSLKQNYPNPFNPTTQIAFELPDPQTVNITVWNLTGQQVATVHTGELNAGLHSYSFDGSQLASGAYIYRINAGPYQATKKMLLMK